MRKLLVLLFVLVVAHQAEAKVYINEMLGSTESSDWEFIELYNDGAPVDISGWQVELWESDSFTPPGSQDASSPYVIPGSTILPTGGFFTFVNPLAADVSAYNYAGDAALPTNSIENSSYTAVLWTGSSIEDSVFVSDGVDAGPNREGVTITPDASIGPDGTFLPAGFYRTTDGGSTLALLNFDYVDLNNGTSAGGTPGASNVIGGPAVPEPTMLLVFGGLAAVFGVKRVRG